MSSHSPNTDVILSFLVPRQQSTRHLYYLQLRKDVLEGGIYVHEETSMLLASYALQAEVGDYNQTLHGSDYFVPEHYLPQRVSCFVLSEEGLKIEVLP